MSVAVAALVAEVRSRPYAYPLGSGGAEEIAVRVGLKAVVRQLLDEASAPAAAARFAADGLSVALRTLYTHDGVVYHEDTVERPPAARRRVLLFAGRDAARVRAAADTRHDAPDGDATLGELLGYPRCCVAAFLRVPQLRPNRALLRATLAASTAPADPALACTDLGVFHLIGWSPCRFDCPASRAYVDALAPHVERAAPGFLAALAPEWSAHRLVVDDARQLAFTGSIDANRVRVSEVWPHARARHPRACLDAAAERDVAAMLAAVRNSPDLARSDDEVVLPNGSRALLVRVASAER